MKDDLEIEVARGGSGRYAVSAIFEGQVYNITGGHLPYGAPLDVIWRRIRRGEFEPVAIGGGQVIAWTHDVPADIIEIISAIVAEKKAASERQKALRSRVESGGVFYSPYRGLWFVAEDGLVVAYQAVMGELKKRYGPADVPPDVVRVADLGVDQNGNTIGSRVTPRLDPLEALKIAVLESVPVQGNWRGTAFGKYCPDIAERQFALFVVGPEGPESATQVATCYGGQIEFLEFFPWEKLQDEIPGIAVHPEVYHAVWVEFREDGYEEMPLVIS